MEKLTKGNQGYLDRLQRAESWVQRAQAIEDWEDYHGQFIFYWIAFNALFGRDKIYRKSDKDDLNWFIGRICDLDREEGTIRSQITPLKSKADRLIKDKFLLELYWAEGTTSRVKRILQEDQDQAHVAWERKKTDRYLEILFSRLQVLRNQIFHGCSTDRRSLNKTSLIPAVELLHALVPAFFAVMQCQGKGDDWPKIPYPRNDSPLNPDSRNF